MAVAAQAQSRSDRREPTARAPASGIVVRRRTLVFASAAGALVAVWAALLTWYAFGQDDFARRFLAHEAELHATYEQRVGALRARLDRVATQKAADQEGLEKRVLDLVRRQGLIEGRQGVLAKLAGQIGGRGTADLEVSSAPEGLAASKTPLDGAGARASTPPAKPTPAPEPFGLRLGAPAAAAPAPEEPQPSRERWSASSLTGQITALERGLDGMTAAQMRQVDGLLDRSRRKAARLRELLASVGLDPDRAKGQAGKGGVGGPLVPISASDLANVSPFEAELAVLRSSFAELERLRRFSGGLPLGRPTPDEAEITSGFGFRTDPFTRSAALHTGIDFRAEPGSPVHATGAGRVVSAEQAGGYGFMVEIDHGNRIVTRYAHLSAFDVVPGQTVSAGTVVGRAGSTGRSTGAHLHYETRVEGEPVDPRRLLEAGVRLGNPIEAR